MRKSFFSDTVVLTLTTQILRIIGLVFIAFLSGKIGPEGIGLYQLIFSVYFLASTLATSGIGIAVSRLTSESAGKSGYGTVCNVVRRSVIFSLILGILVGITLFFSSDFIGSTLLSDRRAVISLKMLSFGLPFMSITSCLRGYFFGVKKAMRPASQMIFEQAILFIILFSIINFFVPKGIEYACFAVAVSATASEVISCGYGILLYFIDRRKSKLVVINERTINRKILKIAVPVAATSYLRAGLHSAQNILIPLGLRRYGMSESQALSRYGLIGMAMPVLLFPSSFLTALATLLIPEISEAAVLGNSLKIKNIFSRVFQLTTILSLLFCGIFMAFSEDFGIAIYNSIDTGALLMLLAPIVPFIYLDFIVDAMLVGLNQQFKTLKINILDYSIRIGMILFLIPRFGFYAYILTLYTGTILNAFLSIRRLLIASDSRIDYLNWVIKPLLSVLIAGLTIRIFFRLIPMDITVWLSLTLKILLMTALYICILFLTGCIKSNDVSWYRKVVIRK